MLSDAYLLLLLGNGLALVEMIERAIDIDLNLSGVIEHGNVFYKVKE